MKLSPLTPEEKANGRVLDGEWFIQEQPDGIWVRRHELGEGQSRDGRTVCVVPALEPDCFDDYDLPNARLIAAAPDLLEAAKVALNAIKVAGIATKSKEMLEAAIAKAEAAKQVQA